jgi:hypothetical protein
MRGEYGRGCGFGSRHPRHLSSMLYKLALSEPGVHLRKVRRQPLLPIREGLPVIRPEPAPRGSPFQAYGRVVKAHRKARMGRNAQTGEAIKIKAKIVVRLRPAKVLKHAVLK